VANVGKLKADAAIEPSVPRVNPRREILIDRFLPASSEPLGADGLDHTAVACVRKDAGCGGIRQTCVFQMGGVVDFAIAAIVDGFYRNGMKKKWPDR
jgi:hypothetical protein